MRRATLFTLFVIAIATSGCSQKAVRLHNFDPASAEGTLEWAIETWEQWWEARSEEYPKNQSEQKKVWEKFQTAFETAKGQTIRWKVTVARISPDGKCYIDRTKASRPSKVAPELNGQTHYALLLIPPGGIVLFDVPDPFPTSAHADWVKSLAPGDTLLLSGEIDDIRVQTATWLGSTRSTRSTSESQILIQFKDARLERP